MIVFWVDCVGRSHPPGAHAHAMDADSPLQSTPFRDSWWLNSRAIFCQYPNPSSYTSPGRILREFPPKMALWWSLVTPQERVNAIILLSSLAMLWPTTYPPLRQPRNLQGPGYLSILGADNLGKLGDMKNGTPIIVSSHFKIILKTE